MSKFEAGDLVYFPEKFNQVLKVCKNSPNAYERETYPLNVAGYSITTDGKLKSNKTTSIYLATPENKAKLEASYGIKLDPALVIKLTSKDIVKTKLDKGIKNVCCWVSDTEEEPSADEFSRMIHCVEDGDVTYFIDTDGHAWFYATPFDPDTDQPITELPE